MRERLLKKVQDKQAATAAAAASSKVPLGGATTAVFTSGEKPAKTPRTPGPAVANTSSAQSKEKND